MVPKGRRDHREARGQAGDIFSARHPQCQRVRRRHEKRAHDGADPQGVLEPEPQREERRVPGREDDPQALALCARQEEPTAYGRGGLADGEAQVPFGERLRLEPIAGRVDHARATAQVVSDVSRRERQRRSTQYGEHRVARCAHEQGECTAPEEEHHQRERDGDERRGIGGDRMRPDHGELTEPRSPRCDDRPKFRRAG